MSPPLVTVVMAVKNGERFIDQAIESVIAQDYPAREILVVDGNSSDRTVEIASGYDGVRVLTQPGIGIANAYNAGIDAATGHIVAFLSHDDLWTTDKLSRQVEALLEDSRLQYVTARAKFFLEDPSHVPHGFRPELLQGSHVAHIMETFMAWRKVFDSVGRFNETLSTAEDVDWFARAQDLGTPCAVVPSTLLKKRIHGDNLSLNVEANNRNLMQALRQSLARKRSTAGKSPSD